MSAVGPSKRHKAEGGPPPNAYHGSYPSSGGGYQRPPYGAPGAPGAPPPMGGPQSGYMWQQGQYGNHPTPPHSYGPPPGSMYPRGGGGGPSMTPDRGGAYGPRGAPPMTGPPRRGAKPPGSAPRPTRKADASSGPDGPPPPPSGYSTGGWAGHASQGQWPQHQWSGGHGPPYLGNGGPPGMHPPPGYGPSTPYGSSPPRGAHTRPRSSPNMMSGYPDGPPGVICQPIENPDMEMYHSRGVGPDDDSGSATGGNSKDKGRGSYKCGRCGVPKKGHVCPYQPKLTRRPGEPLPEMRSAAIQVEMDEFMTLRRLNLKIQGFPESYAVEPYMEEDMVVGEPRGPPPPHSVPSGNPSSVPLSSRDALMVASDQGGPPMGIPQDNSMLGSPMRSSPLAAEGDPITGAA